MKIQCYGKRWEVLLGDDGTLDTIIEVYQNDIHVYTERFLHTCDLRRRDGTLTLKGLRALGLEAIDAYMDSTDV